MKINSIQFMRGAAALLVVFHHVMQQFYGFERTNPIGNFFSDYGHFGVDVFFVISGFIMAYTLHGKKITGASFIKNRVIRILPAYYIFSLIFLLFTFNNPNSGAYYATFESILLSLFFIPHENPSPLLGMYPLLSVGWTLNVEMFFYLILTLFISFKLTLNQILISTCSVLFLLPVLFFVFNFNVYESVAGNWRLLEFLAGIAIAFVYLNLPVVFYSKLLQLGILTVMLTLLYLSMPQLLLDITTAATVIYFALVFNKQLSKSKAFNKFGSYLGNLSYSIYLSHPIILTLFITYIDFKSYSVVERGFLLAFVISLILYISHLSFIMIEQRLSILLKNNFFNSEVQQKAL
mgnify:CR=1 FL=1|jgi:exopolysaccharide production protein ExoZ